MDRLAFEHHLTSATGLGLLAEAPHHGEAGGVACGDLIVFRVDLLSDGLLACGFDAQGCGALTAAGSALASLAAGCDLLSAARISVSAVSTELGGLSPAKVHAAELAVDAFHRALGSAAMAGSPTPHSDRRLVAMSGGVDSSVVAVLVVKDSGSAEQTAGVTVELWRDPKGDAASSCCSHIAVRKAREIAHTLGMAHFTLDLRDEFRSGVVDSWVSKYRAGETPNPCVQCNGRVRIEPMVRLADAIGSPTLATGHYARLAEVESAAGPLLREGVDPAKEQAYALSRVAPETLARLRFPLGGMTKVEVRAAAREAGLTVADQPDSQDLCFLAGVGRAEFLRRHGDVPDVEGPIVDEQGARVGTHSGVHHHTVGQRRGLGIGGGTALYVLRTDSATNTVTVAPKARLAAREVELCDVDLRRGVDRVRAARLRHHAPAAAASLELTGPDSAVLIFEDEVESVAPGQIACLLDGDTVVGCATVAASDT